MYCIIATDPGKRHDLPEIVGPFPSEHQANEWADAFIDTAGAWSVRLMTDPAAHTIACGEDPSYYLI